MTRAGGLAIGPRIVGVQIGQPKEHAFGVRKVRTAIGKSAVTGPIAIGVLGLAGDAQADRRYHGGREKALCVYPGEHLRYWSEEWGVPLLPGSFGENLTTLGYPESAVHIGDRFRFGSALLEVSQPREPCGTLAGYLGRPDLPERIRGNGRTGWYCRVIEPGEGAAGLALVREFAEPQGVTVAEAFRVRLDKGCRPDAIRRLLSVPGLSSGWRVSLAKRL
ncbi:MAG: MOSC domain-containing protein [Gemmatimonadales bacterium]